MTKKIKGECLIADVVTKNNTVYTKEALSKLALKNTWYPIYNEFNEKNEIGIAKCKFKDNKLLFEGKIDDIIETGKIAPQFTGEIEVDEKTKIGYVKNLKLLSISLVYNHSQDEVEEFEIVENDNKS